MHYDVIYSKAFTSFITVFFPFHFLNGMHSLSPEAFRGAADGRVPRQQRRASGRVSSPGHGMAAVHRLTVLHGDETLCGAAQCISVQRCPTLS